VEKYGTARQGTYGDIILRMRIACWVKKATDTNLECVTLIAFPRHQLLHEGSSILRLYVLFKGKLDIKYSACALRPG